MRAAIFLLSMSIVVSAWADEIQADGYENCINQLAPINNAAVYSCSGQVERSALAKIKHLLNKLENRLDEAHFNQLANCQVAWAQYRQIDRRYLPAACIFLIHFHWKQTSFFAIFEYNSEGTTEEIR